jgi:hypothetical protein
MGNSAHSLGGGCAQQQQPCFVADFKVRMIVA